MLTFNHRIAHEFEKLVKLRVDNVTQSVVGNATLSVEQLRYMQGQIAVFAECLEILDDAISICEKS